MAQNYFKTLGDSKAALKAEHVGKKDLAAAHQMDLMLKQAHAEEDDAQKMVKAANVNLKAKNPKAEVKDAKAAWKDATTAAKVGVKMPKIVEKTWGGVPKIPVRKWEQEKEKKHQK